MLTLEIKSLILFVCTYCCLTVFAQDAINVRRESRGSDKNSAQRFTAGFAAVTVNGQAFYIDTLGKRAFDSIDRQGADKLGSGFSIDEYESHRLHYPEAMTQPVITVWKDGFVGLLNPKGEWLLPAEYTSVDVRYPNVWKVQQQGRESYYGKAGVLLPFFDEVGYLDGVYFDVREDNRWGIYNRVTKKMVVPVQYEKLDYCGGCGQKPLYAYAQKNGKWGVIDFQGKVLVYFNYDHEHLGMRSDEWVQSFSKDGHALLIHIPTRKEYPLGDDGYRLLPGSTLAYAVDGKFGIIGKDGKQAFPAEYDDIHIPNDNHYQGYHGPYTVIEKGGKTGVIRDGTVLFQPEWGNVMVYDDFFVFTKDGKSSLWDAGKNELLPPTFAEISHLSDYFYSSGSKGISVFKIKDKALYGLYFPETDTLVKPAYHSIQLAYMDESERKEVIECEYQGRKALYSIQGEELLPLRYHDWKRWYDSDELLQVQLNDKWGLYDRRQGREVIPCVYEQLERLDKSSYVLLEAGDYGNTKKGIRNEKGEVLIDDQYNDAEAVGDGWYLLTHDVGAGAQLFNSQTGNVQEIEWPYVWNLNAQNLLLVSKDGQTGALYDVAKAGVLDGKYNVSYYSNPYGEAEDTNNRYPLLLQFQHGVARTGMGSKIGFVDSLGYQIVVPQYDAATSFNANGIAAVAKIRPITDAWGRQVNQLAYRFIDKSGATLSTTDYPVSSGHFSDLDYFLGEYLIIRQEAEVGGDVLMGLLDSKGNTIVRPEYDVIEVLNGGRYLLLQRGKHFGIADQSGCIILPVKFENMLIDRYAKGKEAIFPLLCRQSSGWMYYTEQGTELKVEGMTDSDVFEVDQMGW